ncbi:gluconokinase [Vagococcus sp.]|uniref:gluconokinase n=1 Tax=Vagococcus sp. TaxID=1933889 RepID=UPI003F9632F4
MKQYIIGIDIGTTSTKAVLYSQRGDVIDYANIGYSLYQDEPDMAEQDVDEIFEAVVDGLTQVIRRSDVPVTEIVGVSFSSAMHSLILLDHEMKPITRSITWADNRATFYSDELKKSGLGQKIYEKTGTPIHPMAPLSKLLWIKNEKPDLFSKIHKVVGIKEYVLYRLFGELKMDYSIASATGLFNIFDLDWDSDVLEFLGLRRDQLPELVSTTYQMIGLNPAYAEVIGLPKEVPFIIGASDGVLSNLGVNAIEEGVLALTIGTSGAIRTVVNHPVTDPKGRLFCYVLTEDMYVLGGPVNNGGIVFRWVRDQLFTPEKETAAQMKIDSYDLLTDMAQKIPAGSDGLIFLPYLGGERAPLWNADARGTYFGLNRNHTRAHMLRSALEGIVFNLYTVLLALEEVSGSPKSIQATGGFARSNLWKQMLADIFERDVIIPESFESSCLGAAVLGLKSLGIVDDLSVVKDMVGTTHKHVPNEENFSAYRQLLPIFIRLSRILNDEYSAITEYQRKYKG